MKDLNKKIYHFVDEVSELPENFDFEALKTRAKDLRSTIVFYNATLDPEIREALLDEAPKNENDFCTCINQKPHRFNWGLICLTCDHKINDIEICCSTCIHDLTINNFCKRCKDGGDDFIHWKLKTKPKKTQKTESVIKECIKKQITIEDLREVYCKLSGINYEKFCNCDKTGHVYYGFIGRRYIVGPFCSTCKGLCFII